MLWNRKWICLALSESQRIYSTWRIGCQSQHMNQTLTKGELKKSCCVEELTKVHSPYHRCYQSSLMVTAAERESLTTTHRQGLSNRPQVPTMPAQTNRRNSRHLKLEILSTKTRKRTGILIRRQRNKMREMMTCPIRDLERLQGPNRISLGWILKREHPKLMVLKLLGKAKTAKSEQEVTMSGNLSRVKALQHSTNKLAIKMMRTNTPKMSSKLKMIPNLSIPRSQPRKGSRL